MVPVVNVFKGSGCWERAGQTLKPDLVIELGQRSKNSVDLRQLEAAHRTAKTEAPGLEVCCMTCGSVA